MLVEHEQIHRFVYLLFEISVLIFDDNQVQVYQFEHLDNLTFTKRINWHYFSII